MVHPFNGKEFSSYLTGLGIRHTTSSPNYPRSNGFIERQIQTVKRLIEKGQQFREESSRSPDRLESTATGRWSAIAVRNTSWEEPCNKKGKPSRFNCSSSVFNCIAGQVHQEPWQGQANKDSANTGDRWGSLFPFREEWMANWHCNWYNWHWEEATTSWQMRVHHWGGTGHISSQGATIYQ